MSFLKKAKIGVVYLWAVLLIVLIPIIFFNLGSGLVQKIGKKIPIREGTFNSQDGSLKTTR
jgi:hypothetical protein